MPDGRKMRVSEKLMALIQDAVNKEYKGPVGTGHVKWPPDELPVIKGDPADELRVNKLVVTVDLENIE